MSTKDQRTVNLLHYPLGDATDPRDLSEYLDDIDNGIAAAVVGPASATNNAVALFDGTTGKLVKNSAVIVNSGAVTGVTTLATSGAITRDNGVAIPVPTQTDFISGIIPAVQNRDYKIVVKLPHALTITETTTISASGTATFTFKINTTALGGTANSVSSSEQSQAHSTNNAASAADDLVITASANAACVYASFTVQFTKTLS